MGMTYDESGKETLSGIPVADIVDYVKTVLARDCGANASEEDRDWITKQILRTTGIKNRDYIAAARRHELKLQAERAQLYKAKDDNDDTTACAAQ